MMGLDLIGDYLGPEPPIVGLDPGDITGLDVAPLRYLCGGPANSGTQCPHLTSFVSRHRVQPNARSR